jgi:competence protein ComEC
MGSVNHLRLTPVLCASLGAAAGFYFLFYAAFAVIVSCFLVLLAVLCLFRVLVSLDVLFRTQFRLLHLTYFCVTALSAGLALGICAANAGRNEVKFSIPEDKVTAVEGVLLEDPRIISGGRAMALVSLQRCAGERGLRASSSGEIIVFFTQVNSEKLKQFGRGTTVFAEGTLRPARPFSSLHTNRQSWTFSAESLHVLNPAPPVERMRTSVRLNLNSRFEEKSWGGLALAMLLGIRDNLDSEFTALYRNAGLSYILALSGMHLAIIAAMIAFIFKRLLGIKASAILGAVIIIIYCFLVGPLPSLNRAVLMYLIGTFIILGSLPKSAMSVLSLSFLIQIIISPAAGNSLSFILSYLALVGILIIGQALYSLFAGKIPDFLLQPLSLSAGAFLATAGIVSASFGIIAPVGIIASLAIVPLTAVFMAGSIIWLLLETLSVSFLLDMPLGFIYYSMETIASVAGKAPGISANPSLIFALSLCLSLSIIALEYRRRNNLLKLQPFP